MQHLVYALSLEGLNGNVSPILADNVAAKGFPAGIQSAKTVREHQAKEKKSFNNPEPVTGFEHTVTFNLMGTKLVIPYGYLARYSKDNRWFSDTPGQDSYFDNFVTVSVHYRKTNQGWVIEPYNRNNREHFIQALKDGLDSMDDIVIKKSTCHLNREMGKWLLDWGFKKIPSDYPEYEAYEEKTSIPENPYIHEITNQFIFGTNQNDVIKDAVSPTGR